MSEQSLDAKNMLCPMPVIKVQNRASELNTGDILEVVCTDPGAVNDVPAWCRINGHEVISAGQEGDEVKIILQIGETDE